VTLGSLLRHRGGFDPWYPLYVEGLSPADLVRSRFGRRRLPTYSDLGVMVWARSVEEALGEPLFELLQQEVLAPLDLLRDVQQAPPDPRRVVECRLGNERERQLAADLGLTVGKRRASAGEAQDGNAHWLGGFPGHAGLFGSARAVWRLAAEWTVPTVFDERCVREALVGGGIYRLGWWAADDGRFWHPGFTGCFVTIDRREGRVEVVLAHRTSHQVSLEDLRERLREVR
jgi:CubicO group peptidase (beta-lactamase class C family)